MPRPQAKNSRSCSSQSPEEKIFQKRPRDCRRDYIFWHSTHEKKSLESLKHKRESSEQISDAELQAASSLAQMSRKKSKKAVKKVVSSGVWWVPSTFDDNLFMEPVSQKGSYFWPLLRFNFQEHCPSGSEDKFVDIDSFSDATPEV
jgi:hypothetical protein